MAFRGHGVLLEMPEAGQRQVETGGNGRVFSSAIIGIEQIQLIVIAQRVHHALFKKPMRKVRFQFLTVSDEEKPYMPAVMRPNRPR